MAPKEQEKEKQSKLPDGVVLPPRFQEFTGGDLLGRFVESDDGSAFAALAEDSKVMCTWRCPGGHEYRETRSSHKRSRGCPVCAGSIATRMPGLLAYWDEELNGQSAADVSAYDRERYHWRCEHNHSFTRAPYRVLSTGHRCQQCRREGITEWKIAGKKNPALSLVDSHPELVAQWDHERNARGPEEFAPGSQREAFWICENGHSWSSAICHRTSTARHQATCQSCKAIAYSAPELAAELHPTLNPPDTAITQRKSSNEPLFWLCDRGHVFNASVLARLRANYPASCDKCRAIAVKAPDLIAACWATELNGSLNPENLGTSSSEVAYWVKLQFLDVAEDQRKPMHYERTRVGYRYRRYLRNRIREDATFLAALEQRERSSERSANG